MDSLLSIIIPAYNAEETIMHTLNSILSLNIEETAMQVVVVDDCSTDQTCDIVQSYVDAHPCITLLKQDHNQKQGAARNKALHIVRGDYVTFVDSDDIVLPELTNAMNEAINRNVDVLICRYVRESPEHELINWTPNPYFECILSGRMFYKNYFNQSSYIGAPWGYLFRTEYLKKINIPFAENVFTEDIDWIKQHLYYAESLALSKSVIYQNNYISNSSTTGTKDAFRMASVFLEYYRELLFAERIKGTDPETSNRLTDEAVYMIDYMTKRLWKAETCDISLLYAYMGEIPRTYLYNNYKWSMYTKFALKHDKLNAVLLKYVSPILINIKKLR